MVKTPRQIFFLPSISNKNKEFTSATQVLTHFKPLTRKQGRPVNRCVVSALQINLNQLAKRRMISKMAYTAKGSGQPETYIGVKDWTDIKNRNNSIDLPIYDSLLAEANHISSESATTDWVSIAAKCIVSQVEHAEKPDTICFLPQTDEPYSLLTRGSISTFTGKAKAGKTTVLALIAASVLKDKKVLWIDTEQGRYYSGITQSYILSIAGVKTSTNLQMLDLRQFTPPEKLKILEALIKDQVYDLIVLDGVRDIVFDINNSEEATTIITKLMAWTVDFNCHIAMVLHYNKGNSDVRGHLGTEAINKSEVVVSITKTIDNPPIAMVSADYSRGLPFPNFYIKRDKGGVPYLDEEYSLIEKQKNWRKKNTHPSAFSHEIHKAVLSIVFKNEEELNSGTFRAILISSWSIVNSHTLSLGESRAKIFQEFYGQQGYVEIKKGQKGNRTLIKIIQPQKE